MACGAADAEGGIATVDAVEEGRAVGFFDAERPRLFGHRGAAGVAPENTLASFARGIEDGACYFEFDVRGTADGHVVVLHDETVDRTTDGIGAVRDMTLEALQGLDAGYRFSAAGGEFSFRGRGVYVPTLDEVLTQFPSIPVIIEIKQEWPSIVGQVIDVVLAHDAAGRVVVATGEDAIMPSLRSACASRGLPTNFSPIEVAAFIGWVGEGAPPGYRPPGAALQIPPEWQEIPLITRETVAAAHAVGVEIHAWTINDPSEMEHLLDLGVDGIITDLPAVGRRVMAQRVRAGP
jgi:glycerophosphoryl diester phosphodiesterase